MKICIDSGHYEKYNQGIVKQYFEGNIMWTISNMQKELLLEYEEVEVILTRDKLTKDLSLTERGKKARNCDLFLSNHSNACNNSDVDRVVIIYPHDNLNKADVLGNKLGENIQKAMGTKQKYQMMTRTHKGGEYYSVMASARAVKCKAYYIIEHSFHTNVNACNWLLNTINLEKLVRAEVATIAKHYNLKKKNNHIQDNTIKHKVVVATLNVRSGRGTEHNIIGILRKNDIINIWNVSKDKLGNDWGSFRYTKDLIGFVSMKYLNITNE